MITAAHCVIRRSPKTLKVLLGDYNTQRFDRHEKEYSLRRIIIHPRYTGGSTHDIAMLQSENEIKFTDYIRPLALPSPETSIKNGEILSAAGWGVTRYGERIPSPVLLGVNIRYVPTQTCRNAYGFVTSLHICAASSGKDSCQGDSGGPLIMDGNILIGIVSTGRGCASPRYPGVYTNVSKYFLWILETMFTYDKKEYDTSTALPEDRN